MLPNRIKLILIYMFDLVREAVLLVKLTVTQLVNKFASFFVRNDVSLPCLQEPVTELYPS